MKIVIIIMTILKLSPMDLPKSYEPICFLPFIMINIQFIKLAQLYS